jgi:hypothetical protein
MRDERIKGCGTLSTETPAARERRVACVDTSIHRGLAHRETGERCDHLHASNRDASKRNAASERDCLLCSRASVCSENGARDRETGAREQWRDTPARDTAAAKETRIEKKQQASKQRHRMERETGATDTL